MFKKIIIFFILMSSFSFVTAGDFNEIVPENIEYCENLYFSDYYEFENIGCDLGLVEKRVFEVKSGNYNEENYIKENNNKGVLMYNDLGNIGFM